MSRSVSAPSSVTYTSPCWNGLIVPGSTLRYGSNFWSWTRMPRDFRLAALEVGARRRYRDTVAPVFAGLVAAVACLPGPVGGDRLVQYHLRWPAAHDDRTPVSRIVYDVYRARSPGGESFARPTYVTKPGATTFVTPPLPSSTTYY